MNIEQINEKLDSEAIAQTTLFSYEVSEYEQLHNSVIELDVSGKELQNLEKKTKNLDKPLAKFVKADIDLIRNKSDDRAMMSLVDKSMKANKFEHALFFAKTIADYDNQNLNSLSLICNVLKKMNADISLQKDAIEKYLDQDLLDTHHLQELSKIHLSEGKRDSAIIDLKKAVQRSIRKNNPQELKICSISLDEIIGDGDKKYMINTLSRAMKTIEKDKINLILAELEKRNHDNVAYSVSLLKEMLKNDPDGANSKVKANLVDQYRVLYGKSERCESCLESSGLLDEGKTNVLQAIDKFEKFVQIEEKAFVSHSTFGLGRITSVSNQFVTIDFVEKRGHKMSIEMANKSLSILDKGHIMVLKEFANREKLRQKFIDDPRWGLVTLIKSDVNTIKLMKAELVPSVLKANEFSKFQDEIKKIIKDDNYISTVQNKNDEYEVRDTPIAYEEKIYRQFRNESSIYNKIKTTRLFLQTEGDQESESFQSMLQYFTNFLKAHDISKNYVVSYLFLEELLKGKYRIERIQKHLYHTEKEVFASIPDDAKTEYYMDIQDAEIKKDYVDGIRKYDEKWEEELEDFYTKQPMTYITRIFTKNGDSTFEERMMKKSIFLSKQNPDLFTYFMKMYPDPKNWSRVSQNEFDLISIQLDVIHTFTKSPSAKYISQNLIDNGKLADFISKCDDNTILTVLYWSIDRNQSIDDITKVKLKKAISAKCPDVENSESNAQQDTLPKKLLCTFASYSKKQKEYENLLKIELPKNAADIAKARELGDLRENSEYQYAKDRQKVLNANVSTLEDEISKAFVVRQEDIDPSSISFGCRVELNNDDGSVLTFTILGPWESDADRDIISFNSPLGRKLYGHTSGERLEFELNDTHYAFTIGKIEGISIS